MHEEHSWYTIDGFESVFKTHYEALCAFAFGIVKDYDVSEELVQELFVKLWAKRKELKTVPSLKSYLYKATRNAALNQIKHHGIKEKYLQYNKEQISYDEHLLSDDLEHQELSIQVKSAIDKLPEERRKVFVMSRYGGLKYKEIAEELNVSIKTVENQMGKALKTLRYELSEYLPAVIVAILLGSKL